MKFRTDVHLPLAYHAAEEQHSTVAFVRVLDMGGFDLARADFPTILGELRSAPPLISLYFGIEPISLYISLYWPF